MIEHNPDCDVNDINPDGIVKPCNCGAEGLKPCPFCGSTPRLVNSGWLFGKRFWMECSYERCPVMLMTGQFYFRDDCVKAWNTRA